MRALVVLLAFLPIFGCVLEPRHAATFQQGVNLLLQGDAREAELEYRAKLAEIAMSQSTTAEILQRFAALGGTSRAVPHAFANRKVHLALEGVAPEQVRAVAAGKLHESTELLQHLGPATVTRYLPE